MGKNGIGSMGKVLRTLITKFAVTATLTIGILPLAGGLFLSRKRR